MVIVVLVALNQSQLEHGLACSHPARSVSTWAVASPSHPHTTSTRVLTLTRPSGLVGCPFSSGGTRIGDEEAPAGGSVETRASVDSGPFARQRKGEWDDADEKAAAVETIIPPLSQEP